MTKLIEIQKDDIVRYYFGLTKYRVHFVTTRYNSLLATNLTTNKLVSLHKVMFLKVIEKKT